MARKDPVAKAEYQREYYRRPGQKEKAVKRVADRKWGAYAGMCVNCGNKTMGNSKGEASNWCSRPECAAAARRPGTVPEFLMNEYKRLSRKVEVLQDVVKEAKKKGG